MIKDFTLPQLITSLKEIDYAVFENDTKPFNLNIVGIRSDNPKVNKFNDLLYFFWIYEGKWNVFQTQQTTLAGDDFLLDPMNKKGCAILVPNQYRSTYKLDLHRGKYLALCQRKPVSVYRDNNKDFIYDYKSATIETGMFGINCHRASAYQEVENVDRNSAGCQVTQDPNDYKFWIYLCQQAQKQWGEWFTYSLIEEKDIIVG
tara:strand:- start:3564 stop:4172 length:609 start_codon:yes stop_codon:yes gene_type:complete